MEGTGRITISETGPYRVEAGTELHDREGRRVETEADKPFFLCRCGRSANKPFCDGTHNTTEWDPKLASRG